MLNNIIVNDNTKFLNKYSKLANEINDIFENRIKPNGASLKTDSSCTKNKFNFLLGEKISNLNKKENAKLVFANSKKTILDKNIFCDDIIKKEKWQELKKAMNPNHYNSLSIIGANPNFDRLKNNLKKMKKEFTLEETFHKNLENLNGVNIISPRNNVTNKAQFNINKHKNDDSNNKNLVTNSIRDINNLKNNFFQDKSLKNNKPNLKDIFSNYYLGSKEQVKQKESNFKISHFNNDSKNKCSKKNIFIDTNYGINDINQNIENKETHNLLNHDQMKDKIFNLFESKNITKSEVNFYNKKHNNLFTWSNIYKDTNINTCPQTNPMTNTHYNTINHNTISTTTNLNTISQENFRTIANEKPKLSYNINLDDSYNKLNILIDNFYEERRNPHTTNSLSLSKNTDYIKRFKDRFEKGAKLVPLKIENKNNTNIIKPSFECTRPKSSILESWNKFDKKKINFRENMNSDILRLELINLNCYSKSELEAITWNKKIKN